MHQIHLDEVRQLKARLREINRIPLSEIQWLDAEGKIVNVDPKDLKFWKFTGLNNADFVETIIDGEKSPWVKLPDEPNVG